MSTLLSTFTVKVDMGMNREWGIRSIHSCPFNQGKTKHYFNKNKGILSTQLKDYYLIEFKDIECFNKQQ